MSSNVSRPSTPEESSEETPPLGSSTILPTPPSEPLNLGPSATSEAEREADKEQLGQLFQKLSLEQQPVSSQKHVSYSPEALRDLNGPDLLSTWPKFLDERFKNGDNRWDPDRWHSNNRKDDEKGGGATGRPGSNLSVEGKVSLIRENRAFRNIRTSKIRP